MTDERLRAIDDCLARLREGGARSWDARERAQLGDMLEELRARRSGEISGSDDLRQAEAEFALVFQHAPLPMILFDGERRVVKSNLTAAAFARRPAEAMKGLRGGEAIRCLHALDDPRGCGYGPACRTCGIRLSVLRTFRTGESRSRVEVSLPFEREGVRVEPTFLLSSALVRTPRGPRVLACLEDVTEQKDLEEELRDRERQARGLLDSVHVGVFLVHGGRRTVEYVNPAALSMLGFREEDLLGRPCCETFGAFGPGGCPVLDRGEGAGVSEYEFRRADGTRLPVLKGVARVERHDGAHVVESFVDLSAHKRDEEDLRRKTAELAARVRELHCLYDTARLLEDPSRPLEEMLEEMARLLPSGWRRPADTCARLCVRGTERASPGFREAGRREARPVLVRDEEAGWVEVFHPAGPDGGSTAEEERLLEAVAREVGRFVERSEAAGARENLEAQLRQAQKLEAVGRLAGGVAHDFNNLLSVVLGFSELLLGKLDEGSGLRADVKEIHDAGLRATDLTRRLLAFSRRQVLEPRVLDLNDVVRGLRTMLGRLLGEDVELSVRLAEGLPRVEADPGQLEQVVMNLAVNARDAMPTGGRLRIETSFDRPAASGKADAVGGPPEGRVCLRVADTGLGMSPEVVSCIFEPFFTTKEKGTGLGLSTVFGIVTQSGGALDVESEPGKGSVFSMYLPASDKEAAEPTPPVARAQISGGEGLVLLVEDEAPVRAVVRAMLEHAGYRVVETAGPAEALAFRDEGGAPPDLVLADVVMPGMSGPNLVEELRASWPALGVLFMSGYSGETLRPYGNLDAAQFIEKPFLPAELAEKVRRSLEAARARGAGAEGPAG